MAHTYVYHMRSAIKAGLKTALLSKTNAGVNVFTSRREALKPSNLPAICIYTPSEKATRKSINPPHYEKSCNCLIQVFTVLDDNYEATLDEITDKIEIVLNPIDPGSILAGASDIELSDTNITIEASDSNQGFAVASMTYDLRYYTEAAEPIDLPLVNVGFINDTERPGT